MVSEASTVRSSRSIVGVPRGTQVAVDVRCWEALVVVLHFTDFRVRPPAVLDLCTKEKRIDLRTKRGVATIV